MEDYYKILGVDRNASPEEIKRAYYKLAQKYHPDKPGGDTEKFKKINEAYQILSNPQKKAQYDQFGRVYEGAGEGPSGFDFGFAGESPFGFGTAFEGFGDIFDTLFEDLGIKQRRPVYRKGSDIEFILEISLEEAFFGVIKKIRYKTYIPCPKCQGLGYDKKAGLKTCPHCNGRGEIRETRTTFLGQFSRVKTCPYCQGLGKIPEKVCSHCQGKGRIIGEQEVDFEIAPGVANGQVIRIKGKGEAGERGSGSGDLYIKIKIKKHPLFERKGNDLYLPVEIDLVKAYLGKSFRIKNIDGEIIELKLSPGFSFKEKIRIPGKGMPILYHNRRGDLYLEIYPKIPKKISAKARRLLEELEKEM